jgi:ADP-heptose:LPS heptosyltransferase
MPTSKKLLIRLSSAGDIILTSPLLKLMRERDTEIHFLVKSIYSDLIRYNPNITTIHLVQEHAEFGELEELRQRLVKEKFDSTFDLHNNFRSVYLRRETSKQIRIIKKDILKRAALVNMKLNFYSQPRSVALKYAQVYDESLTDVLKPEIFYPKSVRDKIDEAWRNSDPKGRRAIFLCPGSKHFTKRWPVENWRSLAKKLAAENHVVLTGGIEDMEICNSIGESDGITNFSGKFSMLESAAMLSHADLVITNDSFLMHAANAQGKKILALFGSSVKEFGFFPYGVENKILEVSGLKCRPCSHVGRESCPKKHFRCMLETTPEMVYSAAMELMNP